MRVEQVMTTDPITVAPDVPLREAARLMRDNAIGDVLVASGRDLVGILTDRDIVVRGLAEEDDPSRMTAGEVCTPVTVTVAPGDPVEASATLMQRHAVRRLPVVSDGRLVGVVSLGDLAAERDPDSVLGGISEAPPSV